MNPLSIAGYPIDPGPLIPDFVKQNEKKSEQEKRLKNLIEEGQEIVNELSDDRGLIVREAVRMFTDRINALVAADPECQVYENLFKSIGMKVIAGEKIARSRAFALTR